MTLTQAVRLFQPARSLFWGLFCFFLFQHAAGQTGNWAWATSVGSTFSDRAKAVAADREGNLYLAGQFNGPITLPSGITLTPTGSYDIFLARYTPEGTLVWFQSMGGGGFDEVAGIGVDTTGHVYLAGYFEGTEIVIDTTTLYQTGATNIFYTRFDQDGNFNWARTNPATGTVRMSGMAVSPEGRMLVTGVYLGTGLSFNGPNFPATNGQGGSYVGCLDSTGNALWGWGLDGTSFDRGQSVSFDIHGNTYLTGQFSSTTFPLPGGGTLTNLAGGTFNAFALKMGPGGALKWAKNFRANASGRAMVCAAGPHETLYIASAYDADTLRIDTFKVGHVGAEDVFLAKLDSMGTCQWLKTAEGSGGNNRPTSLAVDSLEGAVYLAGFFLSSPFYLDTLPLYLAGGNNADIFVARYGFDGTLQLAASAGGEEEDQATGVAARGGSAYVCGGFLGDTAYFGLYKLPSTNGLTEDVFLASLGPFILGNEALSSLPLFPYPNPTTGEIHLDLPAGRKSIAIFDLSGKIIKSLETADTRIETYLSQPGWYLIRVSQAGNNAYAKVWVCP